MTRQSLASLRQTFIVEQPRNIERDGRQALISAARNGNAKTVAEQTSRAGVAPSVEQWANTRGNKNIDTVKLPGPIVFKYDYRREIAEIALDLLRKASPVTSGDYVKNHTILLNGAEVDVLPANLSETDVITLTNPVPYARRIEVGKTQSGRDFVVQVPNRIYERVAKGELARRYRNVAKITFTYIDTAGAHTIKGKLGASYLISDTRKYNTKLGAKGTMKRRLRRQQAGTNVKAPAIEIRAPQVIAI
jgi:hypothetical protein